MLTIPTPDALVPALRKECAKHIRRTRCFAGSAMRVTGEAGGTGPGTRPTWGGLTRADLRAVASTRLRTLVGPDEAARMMGHSPEVAMRDHHVENLEIRGRPFGRPVPSG